MSLLQDEQLRNFLNKLQNVTKFDEVIEISRSIFFMNVAKEAINSGFKENATKVIKLLQKHFSATKLISNHKTIIKALVKLSALCDIYCYEDILEKYAAEYGVIGTNCLSAFGRLQNYKLYEGYIYNSDILNQSFVQGSLKYSKNTNYFALAIENYIQAYDLKLVKKNDPFIVDVICTNLENNHKNTHKLLLELFQKVLIVGGHNEETLDLVLNMSWYNRNKHYLLIQIISTRTDMLLNAKHFNLSKFINGLRCGLSQYHLYSSSLSLVKVIYKINPFREELLKISTEIILNGSEYEMKNFFRFWFSAFDDKLKDELFNAITKGYDFTKVSSTSTFFLKALIIRNAFNRQLSVQIENSVKNFCNSIQDVDLKLEMFYILLSNVYDSKDLRVTLENIMRILKFLHFNLCEEESLFLDTVMKKLPNFFNHLATTRFRNVSVCREIFTIIRDDLFFHGLAFGSYESRVFSIKLLEVILKQYCGIGKGRRLSKKTDSKNNQEFMKYLKVNNIWDIRSVEIFTILISMSRDTENSDICGIANEIIIEYFVKSSAIDETIILNGIPFDQWISTKMFENLNISDVESYHENINYCKMKLEHLLVSKNPSIFMKELKLLINNLEARHKDLGFSKDPVSAMESGKNIFPLIDTINYALLQADRNLLTKDFILNIVTLINEILLQFLNFINDGETSPSFDMLDKNLRELIATSKWKYSYDLAEMKHKLLLTFFFTTRALSELTVTLANIIKNILRSHEDEYYTGLSTCISINVQILTRFCHKGVIESASQSLGCITKIISTEFHQQCDRTSIGGRHLQKLLIILKLEIDCNRRHTSMTGEIRGSRGLVLMAHLIIKNHPPFLKFLMEKFLDLVEINSFNDTQKIKFTHKIQPIHLHLLAIIVKDSELVEYMLPYYDFILLSTFRAYKESKDFVMQNALLQIIGNITPKISNHKRHCIDDENTPQYDSKAISVYEHYVKFTYSYRIALFDFENNLESLSQTYIIILLEILSNFEYRKPYEYWTEMERMSNCLKKLINHSCEKIRVLAAKCFSQWQLPDNIHKIINDKIRYIFYKDLNLAHGSIVAVKHLILRYESSINFVKDFNKKNFFQKLRQKVLDASQQNYSQIPKNFYLRYHLFEFLMFLGFKFDDNIIKELMNEENINSIIGYELWRNKIMEYNIKNIK